MKMTYEILEKGKSKYGAWSGAQLSLFGLKVSKLPKGWQRRLVGNEYPDHIIERFLELKNAHLEKNGFSKKKFYASKKTPWGTVRLRFVPDHLKIDEAEREWGRLKEEHGFGNARDEEPRDLDDDFRFMTEGI